MQHTYLVTSKNKTKTKSEFILDFLDSLHGQKYVSQFKGTREIKLNISAINHENLLYLVAITTHYVSNNLLTSV